VGYAELHFHLLPGVDDGPSSLEESLELARQAAAEGTRTIVATPHVNLTCTPDLDSLPARVQEIADELRRARIPIQVLCGGELAHDRALDLSHAELETIAQGPPGRRWVLLEAPLTGLQDDFTPVADELRARGFATVIAHPERSLSRFHSAWRVLEHEFDAGSAMQVNTWSLAGLYGERTRIDALRILQATRRVCVASDAHGPKRRPTLSLALDCLGASGLADAGRFVDAIPRALLGEGLSARPLAPVEPR
jgi:protein-tyrosine phosphatase